MTDDIKQIWESAAGTGTRFRLSATLYHTLWDTDDPRSPRDTAEWTGTRDEIEKQAAAHANAEMADYPFLHMEIADLEVLDG